MSILEIDTVSFDEATRELVIIDQTLLPGRLELMRLSDAASIREAIRRLCVRGAPAIGVAAALGLYACAVRIAPEADFAAEFARCAEQTDGDAEAAFAAYRAAYTELQPAVPYHLSMARYQLIQEHLPAAEHEIWSIADLPESSRAEYLILRGRLACKKEQYETAAEYLRQADALGPLPKLLERELCQSMELASRELQDYKTAYEYAARQLKL